MREDERVRLELTAAPFDEVGHRPTMLGEHGAGGLVERQPTLGVGLGVLLDDALVARVGDAAPDRQRALVEIDIVPPQATQLAPTCTGSGRESQEHRQRRVDVAGGVHQSGDIFGRRDRVLRLSLRLRR